MQKLFLFLRYSLAFKIIAGLIAFYLLFAYFAVNPLAKKLIPWVVKEQLASNASIKQVTFDPFRLKLDAKGFTLRTKTDDALASFDRLIIDLESSGIFDWAWKFKTIAITTPDIKVSIAEDGKFNWAALQAKLNEDETEKSDGKLPRLIINHININKGHIQYSDASRDTPVHSDISPLDFTLNKISTLPKGDGEYLISATLPQQDGEVLWDGELSVNPLKSKGKLAFNHIDVSKTIALAKGLSLPFATTQGLVDLTANYDFSLIKPTPVNHDNNSKVDSKTVKPKPTKTITLDTVALTLNGLKGTVGKSRGVNAEAFKITVPKIDIQITEDTSVKFVGLNSQLENFTITQKDQVHNTAFNLPLLALNNIDFDLTEEHLGIESIVASDTSLKTIDDPQALFALPKLTVEAINFNLAKNYLSVNHILLNKGVFNAQMLDEGVKGWQQAFATQPPAVQNKSESIQDAGLVDQKPQQAAATLKNDGIITEDQATETTPSFAMDIEHVKLDHWNAHYKDNTFTHALDVDVADINIDLKVKFAEASGLVVNNMSSQINQLKTTSALQNKAVATLDKISLADATIDVMQQRIDIPSIVATGLKTAVVQKQGQPLNWQSIIKRKSTAKSQQAKQAQTTAPKPWSFFLKKLGFENTQVHIESDTAQEPLVLDIQNGTLRMRNITQNLKKPLPTTLALKVKQGGKLGIKGKLTPSPFKADMALNLSHFSLKPFTPLINEFALLTLNSGETSIKGRLAVKEGKTIATAFKGGLSIDNVSILEEENSAPFLAWQSINTKDIAYANTPNLLTIGTLSLDKPAGKFIIYEDKTTNISRILRNSNASKPSNVDMIQLNKKEDEKVTAHSGSALIKQAANMTNKASQNEAVNHRQVKRSTEKPSTGTEAFPMRIEKTRINDAELEFADLSLRLKFGTFIQQLSGVVNGISSNTANNTQVELNGQVDEYGSAKINGTFNPFDFANHTNMKLAFKNIEMNRLTPYSGQFAGRKINSGKMSVDLGYKINHNKLEGDNNFVINKLVLGEKVAGDDATNLPLDLAIAILEDNEGVIDLDLPVSGSLDDPKFSMSGIVWKAFTNIMTKIVTAPFKVLGSLFGGGDKDLEGVAFEAGSTSLQPPALETLKTVSEALAKRKGLTLRISPTYMQAKDTPALQASIMRANVAKALNTPIPEGQLADPIDVGNEATQAVLKTMHDKLTKRSFYKRMKDKLNDPEPGYYKLALEQLTAAIDVTEKDLNTLAVQRGEAVKQQLSTAGIDPARITLETAKASKEKGIKTTLAIGIKGGATKAKMPIKAEEASAL